MSISVMLVDDHKMLREGIVRLIEFDSEIKVVAQASNETECLDILKKVQPDIMILDINLPETSGLELLTKLKATYGKEMKFLMLTVHNEVDYLIDALHKGADGYILKEVGSGELIKAIKAVYANERYIQPELIPSLNARLIKLTEETDKVSKLTKREHDMLCCIAEGMSNKDIGTHLGISERTVKNHITSLFKKIGVIDRTQAAVYAIKYNFVKL